jgi:tape measure domain-containing protein
MALDLISLGYKIDTAPIKSANSELDKLGKTTKKTTKDTSDAAKENEKLTGSLKALAGAYIGLAGATKLVALADQYTKLTAQLKLATRSQEEFNQAFTNVQNISKVAQSGLSETAVLYARVSNATRDLGANQATVAAITESVSLGLKVSGASAAESASAMLQLSQAFASGVLRGEEFNAVNEAAPRLMKALADGMGVPIGALRNLASDGKITSDILGNSLVAALADLRKEAAQTQTISGAFVELKNEVLLTAGQLDSATGASKAFAQSIKDLAGSGVIKVVFETIAVLGANIAYVFKQIGNEIGGIAAQIALLFQGDFQGAKFIGEQMKLDAAAARKEIDALTESILNPKVKDSAVVEEVKNLERATVKAGETTKAQQKAVADARKQAEKERNAEEVRRLNVAIWTNEQIYEAEQKLEKETYQTKLKNIELLQKQSEERFREEHRLQEELLREQKRANEEFSKSLTDALFRGFEDGKDFIQNFKDTLLNAFQTLILRPRIEAIISGTGIGGLLSGSALAGEGAGGTSLTELFTGGGKTIFDMLSKGNAGIISGIESLGTFLSDGLGGLSDTLGGFIGANAGTIANLSAFGGAAFSLLKGDIKDAAFQGAGAGIGLALGGPIGGAIGSLLGGAVGGLFGGDSLPPRVTESRTGSFNAGKFNYYEGADSGKRKIGAASSLDALNLAFTSQIGSFLSAFGVNQAVSSNSMLTKKKNVRSRFNAAVGGQFLGFEEMGFGEDGTFQQAFNAMMESAMGSYTVKALQASALPAGIKKFFSGLTKKEDVTATINTLISLKTQLKDLPPVFNAVRNAISTTAYQTSIDALKAQFNATQTFVNLFYTDAEKFGIFTKQLKTQLASINAVMPKSREEYRATVDAIKVTNEATRNQFNGLIALAPAMNEYFNLLDQQKTSVDAVNESLTALRDNSTFKTLTDFQRYEGVARNYGTDFANQRWDNIASFDTGTSYVPKDGVAMIHEGEAVLTRSQNASMTQDSATIATELKALRIEVTNLRHSSERTAIHSKRAADVLVNVSPNGDAIQTELAA